MTTASYYLPCECGVRSVVDASQCGRTLTCQCGRSLEVPPLRGLRQLAEVQVAASRGGAQAVWHPARGLALLALLTLIGSVGFGVYAYVRVPQAPPPYPSLEGRSPRDILYQVWFPLVERGIDDSSIPVVRSYIEQVDRRRGWLMFSAVVASLSAVGVVVGLFWPSKRAPAGPSRASRGVVKPGTPTPQSPAA